MKEPHGKGIANHSNPESCAGHGNMAGEALTRAHAGQPLSSEIIFLGADLVLLWGRQHHERRPSQVARGRRGVCVDARPEPFGQFQSAIEARVDDSLPLTVINIHLDRWNAVVGNFSFDQRWPPFR